MRRCAPRCSMRGRSPATRSCSPRSRRRSARPATTDGAGGYIAAKRAERAARHRRYGDSPFVVEPNIKEGRGGLRDLQTLYWMSRYVFAIRTIFDLVQTEGPAAGIITLTEARLAKRSWDFLWTLRFHLHYVTGRAEERLTFDLQPVVGARMGYTRARRARTASSASCATTS